MGKRGKAARKRRRENEVNAAVLASKVLKRDAGHETFPSDDGPDDGAGAGPLHGVSDAALDATVATLRRLRELVDPSTGKPALKGKRYRGLRKVLFELRGLGGGSVLPPPPSCALPSDGGGAGAASPPTAGGGRAPAAAASSSKIAREISAQIDNGAWELAVTTLRSVRARREAHDARSADPGGSSRSERSEGARFRPKLGSVQRWVRQVDAAGTDDPLAVEVLDAILRVVAPESIVPTDEEDALKARWATLGVTTSTDGEGSKIVRGRIRLFPSYDRRQNVDDPVPAVPDRPNPDVFDALVSCMKAGEDGIRRIATSRLDDRRSELFRKCGFERGEDRKPPNKYDLELVTTAAIDGSGTLSGKHALLDDERPPVAKTPLRYVRGSFLLENVLSPGECDRLIAAAETAGYRPDEPLAGQPGESTLANACVWMVDRKLERTIFDRVRRFLPSYDAKGEDGESFRPLGLNRRFRFYRYVPGRYYRPHIDGAWPPSGFDERGNYRYDACDAENKNGLQFVVKGETSDVTDSTENIRGNNDGEEEAGSGQRQSDNSRRQLSRLTFLIYLNDDFLAGQTTFLIPAKDEEGVMNAFPINPVRGGALVFPHGTCAAPLHEGSPVLKRAKYVVRTEVEYYI
ncbi:hypothetical protein ACHAWF_017248 [Thalassiosira exigua]